MTVSSALSMRWWCAPPHPSRRTCHVTEVFRRIFGRPSSPRPLALLPGSLPDWLRAVHLLITYPSVSSHLTPTTLEQHTTHSTDHPPR